MNTKIQSFIKLTQDLKFKEKSFGLLVDIVDSQVKKSGVDNLNSDNAVKEISAITKKFTDDQFAFLLMHSCYIPDHYPETGSEETLFSKLVEYLVSEWGNRLGYIATLQKEKSTKEDVTFFDKTNKKVVVCDAKSNRLGRSQKSPNVKDVMKTSEYSTWIKVYSDKKALGGFATFPSLMEWARGSEVHTYLTDKSNPIMLIYNEYLAYMLLKKDKNPNLLFDTLENYSKFFPEKITNKDEAKNKYQSMLVSQLKTLEEGSDFEVFLNYSKSVIQDYVQYSINRLESIIKNNQKIAEEEVKKIKEEELKQRYIELKSAELNKEYERLLENIINFRKKA